MKYKRQDAIFVLVLICSFVVGQLLVIATAPIHEFGHYIVAKYFGWDVVDVDWYSHVELTEETMNTAPLTQKILVSSAGTIFGMFIPCIIFIKTKSLAFKIPSFVYMIFEFCAGMSDYKKIITYLIQQLTGKYLLVSEYRVSSPMNLIATILTVVVVMVLMQKSFGKYIQYVKDLSIEIENMDSYESD